MRSEEITTLINSLKEEIQLKFGSEIAYAKDCQILSRQILETTKRQLSESTLKRFFGIIASPFRPSKYTLDTLAVYLDFINWQDFVNSFEKEKHVYSQYDSWEQLKNRVNVITELSFSSIRSKDDALFKDIPLREFADLHFQSFLNAPQIATAFVAPGGYGKTTLITQLTENYFTGDSAKYPDDIVCMIDGSSLFNLLSQNENINRLSQLLKFDSQNSFSNYFRENPDKIKGRFVMIVDGFNEMYFSTEKLNQFIGNLMKIIVAYENVDWFKLIVSCRPDVWRAFSSMMKNNPFLQSQWYNVSLDEILLNWTNVPLLSEKELNKIATASLNVLKSDTQEMQSEMNNFFRTPVFIHLLQTGKISQATSEFELLKQYLSKVLLSGPYQVERTDILKSFVQQSDKGRKGTFISKDNLSLSGNSTIAYNEIVSYGILREFFVSQSFLDLTTYVEFSQGIIFEFLVANKWIEENELNCELIKSIYNYYPKARKLRDSVLKFVIQYAFLMGQSDFLKEMLLISELMGESLFTGLKKLFESEQRNDEYRKAFAIHCE